jgi:feruloyl esterase
MKRLLMAAGAAVALGAPAMAHAETACADLKQAKLPHAEVTAAASETFQGKALCKVSVTSRPTADSSIGIEVWIPEGAAWNGKFLQLGNGGFAGNLNSGAIRAAAARGYAAAGTDNGHRAPGTNAAWALGHPEKLKDFGWRSLEETTTIGKALVKAQKAEAPKRSYFQGCSDGGREALMMAQRYPTAFDGIVAGAPANYMSLLFGNGAGQQQALARPGGYLDKPALELLTKSAIAQCSPGEAFVRDPAACRFDPGKLTCKPGQAEGCLSAAQVATARAIYSGRRDPRSGKVVLPGIAPGGEAWNGGWQVWITGPTKERNGEAAGYQFSSNAFKYFAFGDPSFDFLKMDLGAGFDRAKAKMSPIIDSEDPNLAAFKRHGGKLIQFHGWNDPAIPAASSIRYYGEVQRTMGQTDDFYRLYLIPGMLHCGGGAGPSNVDWLSTLDAWVTDSKAPGELTATGAQNASQKLCPYPGVARKSGEAWACALPGKRS